MQATAIKLLPLMAGKSTRYHEAGACSDGLATKIPETVFNARWYICFLFTVLQVTSMRLFHLE